MEKKDIFIGDGFRTRDGGVFKVNTQDISVSSITIENSSFSAVVIEDTINSSLQHIPQEYDSVVVGIRTDIQSISLSSMKLIDCGNQSRGVCVIPNTFDSVREEPLPKAEELLKAAELIPLFVHSNIENDNTTLAMALHNNTIKELDIDVSVPPSPETTFADHNGMKISLLPRHVLSTRETIYKFFQTSPTLKFKGKLLSSSFLRDVDKKVTTLKTFFKKDQLLGVCKEIEIENIVASTNETRQSRHSLITQWRFRNISDVVNCFVKVSKDANKLCISAKNIDDVVNTILKKYEWKQNFVKGLGDIGFLSARKYYRFDCGQIRLPGDHLFYFISKVWPKEEFTDGNNFIRTLKNTRIAIDAKWKFSMVDLDWDLPDEMIDTIKSPIIRHFSNGVCICENVIGNINDHTKINYIKFTSQKFYDKHSGNRAVFRMSCPICPTLATKKCVWTCLQCKGFVEYVRGGIFLCDCGNFKKPSAMFKCHNYFHKDFMLSGDLSSLITLATLDKLKPLTFTNIVLIGQSGVGKSTWINGFANYLRSDFDEAMKVDPITVVPGRFNISDDDHNMHEVVVGEDDNENSTIGASATQSCRSYALYYGNQCITLIDTPGLCDTRGYEQDVDNIKNIIQYLRKIKEIHAIFFLLKPNESRSNASFRYCLKEIMCYLHRRIVSNLVFVFTNARSSAYRPGDTYPILKEIVGEAQQLFEFTNDNIYLFDNESYRLLCALKKSNVKFTKEVINIYKTSWDKSTAEAQRLLESVLKRPPYSTKHTVDLGHVQFRMRTVMKKVVDSGANFSEKDIQKEISRLSNNIRVINEHSFVPVEEIEQITVEPRLVCSNGTCCKFRARAKLYKICMPNCTVSRNFNTLSNAELRKTEVLNGVNCTVCGCRWEHHMVINYEQKIKLVQKQNSSVIAEVQRIRSDVSLLKSTLKELKQDAATAEARKLKMMAFAKKLATYLAQHAFFLKNDATTEYLDFLIKNLESEPKKTDLDFVRLDDLKASKKNIEEISKIMKQFHNVTYVTSSRIAYMTKESLDDHEKVESLKLPKEDLNNSVKYAEKRIFIC